MPLFRAKQGLRLLVVDDHAETAEYLGIMLTRAGYQVITALDGAQGLEQARIHMPDVVISDLGLPIPLDGFALGDAIRALNWARQPHLVAITGFDGELYRQRALDAGYTHYLLKPVLISELLAILEMLGGSSESAE